MALMTNLPSDALNAAMEAIKKKKAKQQKPTLEPTIVGATRG